MDSSELIKNFKWRTSDGEYLDPKDMDTKHLFFTVRMIWNHSAPVQIRIYPYRRYRFVHSIYTPEYMATAVYRIMEELSTRTLEPYYERCLKFMADNFKDWRTLDALQPRNNHAALPER